MRPVNLMCQGDMRSGSASLEFKALSGSATSMGNPVAYLFITSLDKIKKKKKFLNKSNLYTEIIN